MAWSVCQVPARLYHDRHTNMLLNFQFQLYTQRLYNTDFIQFCDNFTVFVTIRNIPQQRKLMHSNNSAIQKQQQQKKALLWSNRNRSQAKVSLCQYLNKELCTRKGIWWKHSIEYANGCTGGRWCAVEIQEERSQKGIQTNTILSKKKKIGFM